MLIKRFPIHRCSVDISTFSGLREYLVQAESRKSIRPVLGGVRVAGLYSKHVPIVPVLVELWSGQVNAGSW